MPHRRPHHHVSKLNDSQAGKGSGTGHCSTSFPANSAFSARVIKIGLAQRTQSSQRSRESVSLGKSQRQACVGSEAVEGFTGEGLRNYLPNFQQLL